MGIQNPNEKVVFVPAFTYKSYMSNLRGCFIDFLATFHQTFSDQIHTYILNQAEKTFDVNLQNSLFQLSSRISEQLPVIQKDVLTQVTTFFERQSDKSTEDIASHASLEIQSEYQVEVSVVVNTVKGVIHSEAYLQLQRLLKACEKIDESVGSHTADVFPSALLTLLLEKYSMLTNEDAVNVIFTRLLKHLLLDSMVELTFALYRQIEALELDVEDDAVNIESRQTASNLISEDSASNGNQTSAEMPASPDGHQAAAASKQETKAIIAWLNSGLFIPAVQMDASSAEIEGQVISTAEIVRLINENGHQYTQNLSMRGQALSQVVLDLMVDSEAEQPQLSQVDVRLIKLVEMLFDFLWSEEQIPTYVKVAIARLQLPTLKFALTSHDFLDNDENPIRVLIDALSSAGVTVESEDDPVMKEIEKVIDKVIHSQSFKQEVIQAIAHFEDFLAHEEKRAKIIEKRTYSTEFGLASSKHAQDFVDQFLDAQLSMASSLSEHTSTYLKKVWGKVLYITYLQKGTDDTQWNEQAALLEELVWSLSPNLKVTEKALWMQRVPEIVKQMKAILVTRIMDPFEMGEVFSELRRKHLEILNKLEHADEQDYFGMNAGLASNDQVTETNAVEQNSEQASEQVKSALEKQKVQAQAQLTEVLSWFEGFELGDWFLFVDENKKKVRFKLSCMLEQSNDVLFVNRFGMIVKSMHLKDFYQSMSSGVMRRLNREPFFERALRSVGRNIMQQDEHSTSERSDCQTV